MAGWEDLFCEYRGEREEAAKTYRRAVEVLEAAGHPCSAAKFQKRHDRLSAKKPG